MVFKVKTKLLCSSQSGTKVVNFNLEEAVSATGYDYITDEQTRFVCYDIQVTPSRICNGVSSSSVQVESMCFYQNCYYCLVKGDAHIHKLSDDLQPSQTQFKATLLSASLTHLFAANDQGHL